MTDQNNLHSYAGYWKRRILACMTADNLTDLIEILIQLEDVESDSTLEEGQVYTSDGKIVTL